MICNKEACTKEATTKLIFNNGQELLLCLHDAQEEYTRDRSPTLRIVKMLTLRDGAWEE